MIAVTVPLQAMGDDGNASPSPSGSSATDGQGAPGSAAAVRSAPGVVEDAGPVGERGSGRDPLTPDEVQRARKLAVDASFRARSRDVHGGPGPEYLRTEFADTPGARTADVYFFNYEDRTVVKRTVDLDAGKVTASSAASGIQPPPSREETDEAVKLLLADGDAKRLKANYRDATGKPLTRPAQLNSRGLAYGGSGGELTGASPLGKCAKDRCLSLFTRVSGGGPWIDVTDLVIDLTDRTVTRIP
jgi:hypothetical protein